MSGFRPDGSRETYHYDAADRLTAVTDPLGRVTRYGYNGQGQLTTRIDAKGQTLGYRYDAALQLVQLTNQNGEVTRFQYDPPNCSNPPAPRPASPTNATSSAG